MSFYDLLEQKMDDWRISRRIAYIDSTKEKYTAISYEDLYNLVNNYINLYIEPNKEMKPGKKVEIIVDNSIEAIAMIIALLKCHLVPIIFDCKNIVDDANNEIFPKKLLNFPLISRHLENPSLATKEELEAEKKRRAQIEDLSKNVTYWSRIESIYDNSEYFPYNPSKSELIICTSGSEGVTPHFSALDEKKLIENKNQYAEKGSRFLSYITCGNISGILTNIVDPLLNDTLVVLTNDFNINLLGNDISKTMLKRSEKEKNYYISYRNPTVYKAMIEIFVKGMKPKIEGSKLIVEPRNEREKELREFLIKNGYLPDSVMLPRDIVSYLSDYEACDIDLSNLKHIYLSGGANNYDVIKKMRTIFSTLKPNVFENLYGSTESYGVVSKCKENNLKTCYIDISKYNGKIEEIRYTYDKIHFFSVGYHKSIPIKENTTFDEMLFTPYMSVSEERLTNVRMGAKLSIYSKESREALEPNFKELNDLGVYIDNQLYILGRKGDLIKSGDNSINYHLLSSIEEYLRRELKTDVYCVLSDESDIQVYVDIKNMRIEQILNDYYKCLNIREEVEKKFAPLKMAFPVFLNEEAFPRSKISGKVSKGKLKEFARYEMVQHVNIKKYPYSLKNFASKILIELFADYNFSEINFNNMFCITVNKKSFYPLTLSLNRIFEICSTDDEQGKIWLKIKPNILFLTEEELIKILEDIKNDFLGAANEMNIIFDYKKSPSLLENYKHFLESNIKGISNSYSVELPNIPFLKKQ